MSETDDEDPGAKLTPITVEWAANVDRWLTENGKDRQWLATQLAVPPSTVKRLLSEQGASRHVARICEITGLPPPVLQVTEWWELQAIDDLRHLETEDRDQIRAIARSMRAKSK
jgi:hypothetical protein